MTTAALRRAAMVTMGLAGLTQMAWGAQPSPVNSVDVFIGTGGHGHTYPGATVPFGFVQLSPDTPKEGWDGCSGYHYSDSSILGFSHTHLSGTGCGDLGDILIQPVTGPLQSGSDFQPMEAARFASPFSHDKESASPGYYRVQLDRYNTLAELTATAHVGVHRYTFPAGQDGHVLVDLVRAIGSKVKAATLTVESDHVITGMRTTDGWANHRSVYFVIEASRPFTGSTLEADGKQADAKEAKGVKVRAAFDFKADTAPLVLKVGLSATSIEEAKKNLAAEAESSDFDAVRTAARDDWNQHLSRLAITTQDATFNRTFYTALYHTMVAPTLYNDADGTYRGHDGKVHEGEGFQNYSTFSMWDTFRAEHPLLTLTSPERVTDFVRSALAFYQQSSEHALPMWPLANWETHCMIGYHAVPVIYDAYAKGFTGFDPKLALQAMQDTALKSPNAPKDYDTRGYVVADPKANHQAAARTLEYSYDDWCISHMAAALGEKDVANHFDKRSKFYQNIFDSNVGFFRGKTAGGDFPKTFDPKLIDFRSFTEANAWQYAFFVPQDVPDMERLYGGREAFVAKLDACFDQDSDLHKALVDVSGLIGQYSHGNEPSHHAPYLYAMAGAQDKTAKRVHQIMRLQYDDTPEGLCGNDDCGQISAWYVWSAIGLYPLNPADGRYVIGSPMVKQATLTLDPKFAKGEKFTVIAHDATSQNIYVQSAKLNGKPLHHPWVTHAEVTAGGTLELNMGMFPNRTWGGTLSDDEDGSPATPGKPNITMDASAAPDLADFAKQVQQVANTWYPKELELMRPGDATAPSKIHLFIDNDYQGVAETSGDQIRLATKWFRAHPDDLGAIVHELAHVAQQYPNGAPGWFTEGFADYVRWFIYEPADKRPHPNPAKATYHDSYRTSASFLNYVAQTYGQAAVLKVDAACRRGEYQENNWASYTGKSLEQLNDEWLASLKAAK